MADLKRQTAPVGELVATDEPELRARAEHYSKMALIHSTVSMEERRRFSTTMIRHLNNFVKSSFIDATVRALVPDTIAVGEVASGRGQDHAKYMYGSRVARKRIAAYYGLDLSVEDTVSARLMAAKYLPDACVSIETGDMTRGFSNFPDASVDVLSCQLALHYACSNELYLKTFFKEAKRVLKSRGYVLVSFTDGRSIVRRGRDQLTKVPSDDYDVVIKGKFYKVTIPSMHLRREVDQASGLRYVFELPGSLEGIPEYLCHEGLVSKIARRTGLIAGTSMYFDEAGAFLSKRPHYQEIGEKMGGTGLDDRDALDTANLYRIMVFATSTDDLRRWDSSFEA